MAPAQTGSNHDAAGSSSPVPNQPCRRSCERKRRGSARVSGEKERGGGAPVAHFARIADALEGRRRPEDADQQEQEREACLQGDLGGVLAVSFGGVAVTSRGERTSVGTAVPMRRSRWIPAILAFTRAAPGHSHRARGISTCCPHHGIDSSGEGEKVNSPCHAA